MLVVVPGTSNDDDSVLCFRGEAKDRSEILLVNDVISIHDSI